MQFYASPEIVSMSLSRVRTMSLYEIKSAPPPPPPTPVKFRNLPSDAYMICMQSDAFQRCVVEEQYTEARSTFMRTRLGVLIVIIFIMGPEGGGGGPDPQDPLAGSALVFNPLNWWTFRPTPRNFEIAIISPGFVPVGIRCTVTEWNTW